MADVSDLLERLDLERRVYGQRAFNSWLHRRSLTNTDTTTAVVDRLHVSTPTSCQRNHSPRVIIQDGLAVASIARDDPAPLPDECSLGVDIIADL